jgi:hypothetical protein
MPFFEKMYSFITGDNENFQFPNDIEGFGYKFDEDGELKNIDTSNYYNVVNHYKDKLYYYLIKTLFFFF